MFPTMFSRQTDHLEFVSEAGSPYLDTYNYKFDEDGVKSLVCTGKDNIYDKIQASADSVDINVLIARFANGDTEAFNKTCGFYADTTDMPSTYAEMFERNEECRQMFEVLPVDIKEKFNNSYTEFWASYGSEKFMSIINPVKESVVKESDINESNGNE